MARYYLGSHTTNTNRHRSLVAEAHFAAGHLRLAESLCRELCEDRHSRAVLTELLGQILLLRNRTAEAEPLPHRRAAEQGDHPRLLNALAECLRRDDRLAEASDLYRRLGRLAFAGKLQRLADGRWDQVSATATANLRWASHTELPLVEASVNGAKGHFLLDTGVVTRDFETMRVALGT